MKHTGLIEHIGQEYFSDWFKTTQHDIDLYTQATRDGRDEWIHLDPVRAAKEGPFGGTIVQGFFQTALLSELCAQALNSSIDLNHALNYGFDRLRFSAPLPVGAHVRAHVRFENVAPKGENMICRYHVELECKETQKVTMIADWLFLLLPGAFGTS
jgi:acyl dehydratase